LLPFTGHVFNYYPSIYKTSSWPGVALLIGNNIIPHLKYDWQLPNIRDFIPELKSNCQLLKSLFPDED
jgi:hypothetical protein